MSLDIIQTLTDKKLLGQFLQDTTSWKAWLTFLKAFFALNPDPDAGDQELFARCTGRATWPKEPAREAWLVIGTRGGKSYITALLSTYLAIFREYSLSPGERGYILVIAPTKRQAGLVKGYISTFFSENVFLRPYLVKETVEDTELSNGIIISTLSSDYKGLRGYTAIACIIDEIAYLAIEGSKPDSEVVRALRSRLITTKGPLICISSPYAKAGQLYETYKKHFGMDGSSILIWQASSETMNPLLNSQAIAAVYEEDPEGAKADYGAQFRSDISSYISPEIVDQLIAYGCHERAPVEAVAYNAFTDMAGGSGKDSATLAIAHAEGGKSILDLVREVRPPFSPEQTVEEFSFLLKRYSCQKVFGDKYAGDWPRERFSLQGIQYELESRSKSEIYIEALPLLMSGQVELLDNDILKRQLCDLERRTHAGGRQSVDHPLRGGHDDVCNSACGAIVRSFERRRGIFTNLNRAEWKHHDRYLNA